MTITKAHGSMILFIILIGSFDVVNSGPANPYPFQLHQDVGGRIRDLFYHGSSPVDSVVADINGYTVIQDEYTSNFVYAIRNEASGHLVSSGITVGESDPKEAGIPKSLLPFPHSKDQTKRRLVEGHQFHHRQLQVPSTGTLKNLVILVRFKNHKNRILPTSEDFNIVFNHDGENNEHHDLAPTGSVRDVYRVNSYGKLIIESTVYGWVDLPETEAYYAGGVGGFATSEYMEALHSAMDALRDNFEVSSFSDFDGNGDGKVDMVTLIHSGYASEVNGEDEDGANGNDRIWSHHRKLPKKRRWYPDRGNKSSDAFVYQYGTAPALYGASGASIGRIGVICHEIGHALGLPDLYGTAEGNGVGSYDFMSNHWGFPPYFHLSQLYPPILSPWSKMKAGWLDPFVIDKSGNFIIEASHSCDQIFRLNLSDEGTEYLLIENRQPIGFDFFLPQGGLAIWHIDEIASNVEGFPEQEGIPWPVNGKHYKVSLLQADGAYDLENRRNNGDEFDLFHKEGVDFLAPSVNFMEGPYPSTDSYQKIPARTGILIHQISHSAPSMSFSVNLMNELSSAFLGGNGASGTMFDILPVKDINIRKIYLNLAVDETVNVELWTRTGTHISFENKPWLWQRSVVVSVDGNGRGKKSCMDIENLPLNANTRYGFYLVLTKGRFRYTNGIAAGSVSVSNEDLTVYEGVGLTRPFGKVYQNRIWNGGIFYDVLSEDGERSGGRRLETTFDGGSGQDGVMFDVLPKHDLDMDGFDLHLIDSDTVCVHIYTKEGPFTGSENKRDDWILLAKMNVKGKGINVATKVLLDHSDVISLKKDKLQAFYIFIENGRGLRYTEGHGTGNPVRSDDNLTIFEGVGVASQFGSIFQSRVWNGALHYRIKKN